MIRMINIIKVIFLSLEMVKRNDAFFIMLIMFIVCWAVWGVKYAVSHIKSNNERAAGYIDNAFDSEEEK